MAEENQAYMSRVHVSQSGRLSASASCLASPVPFLATPSANSAYNLPTRAVVGYRPYAVVLIVMISLGLSGAGGCRSTVGHLESSSDRCSPTLLLRLRTL